MQMLKINQRVFKSITDAAKFIGVSKLWLASKIRDKQSTIYKDLLIEKVEKPKKVRSNRSGGKPIPVVVDGIPYNSCGEAERLLNLKPCCISKALWRGATSYKGYKVEPVFPSMMRNKPKPKVKQNAIQVVCETTGVVYKTILDASRVAGVDSWTMSKKMEFAGSFVDKNGNVYKRLKPMSTKNVYKNTGTTLSRTVMPYTKTPVDNTPKEPKIEEKPTPKNEVPQIVKDAINEKIVKILKDKGCYDEIIELLVYGGFTSIRLVKEND